LSICQGRVLRDEWEEKGNNKIGFWIYCVRPSMWDVWVKKSRVGYDPKARSEVGPENMDLKEKAGNANLPKEGKGK
jgi:hypothetical protein